jgi:hypothetical protein
MTTKPPLQKILQRILQKKSDSQHNQEGQTVPNHRRRKDKRVEGSINLATQNQTLKQLRQLNDRNHHIPINTNTQC